MSYLRNFLLWIVLASCSQAQPPTPVKVPSGYLYKVDTGIPGQTVYVCGERPYNTNGDLVGSGDLGAQTRQIFENLKTSLATVNMSLTDVTQVKYSVKDGTGTTLVSDADSQLLKTIQATYFATAPKIVEMKSVTQTVREDVLIEVEVIAVK
ncbi:RidA family protein [Spirosoma sp. KCTC 42546]|uniref:RidA family protein n=1 Tax=Spirosoma sp. KCTC 42546 TaxID=2520506 RepID=UPI0011591BB2|nr:RidA family protein [Spirosoma sp. KCTC 42546]QDK78651.1 RidA family protein [Spirosoma sp. KCTC 42546]